mgnify:CR=1 FL=1
MRAVRGVVLSAAAAIYAAAPALAQAVTANAVKAAYLTKFAPFVEWPASSQQPDSPFVICIIGRDPFGDVLDRIAAGQKFGTHPIAIKRIQAMQSDCRIVYAGSSTDAAKMSDAARKEPVLTVSDADTDGGAHGIICFVREKDHVRFDIDAGEARQHGLVMSSKLLDLARKIVNPPEVAP